MTCWNGFDMRLRDRFVKMTEYSWNSPRSSFGTGRYSSLEAASAGGGGGGGSIVDNEERKRPEEERSAPEEGEEAARRSNATGGAAAKRAADAAAAALLPVFRAMLLVARCVAARIPEDMALLCSQACALKISTSSRGKWPRTMIPKRLYLPCRIIDVVVVVVVGNYVVFSGVFFWQIAEISLILIRDKADDVKPRHGSKSSFVCAGTTGREACLVQILCIHEFNASPETGPNGHPVTLHTSIVV